jgi:DNA primase
MKGITSEVIAEVRSRASLLEVVSEHVVLKRAGKEHRGLCPFHAEKTPSFHVNLDKGIYKCFGCGEGGDVFAFVQKVKGLDFLDAVRDLAQKYGVRLVDSAEERQEHDRRTIILMLYQQAAEYYARLLKDPREGAPARDYLRSRGVTDEIVERFKLGYAPNVWEGLLRYLTNVNKVSPQTLEEAGLVRRRPDSTTYFDLFRHRLMIPICDEQGRVIAFGGRTLGDDQIKYLNSPESPIYTKGHHLFAFHLAREAIKSQDSVIVVEGYFDAITAHQYGFQNAVATLGTALTERQAKLLVRHTESRRVYLAFDADAAGEKAMERGVETLNQIAEGVGIELRVIRVPGGKDPDECLRSVGPDGGTQAFSAAVQGAPLLVDYELERAVAAVDLGTHTGRIEAARAIVPILGQIKNAVARGEYIRQWALRIRVREEELLADVGQFRRRGGLTHKPPPVGAAAGAARSALRSGHTEAGRNLLALYLSSRDDYERAAAALGDQRLLDPVHQRIKESIEGIGTQFVTIEDLGQRLQDRLAPDPEASRELVEVILRVEEIRKQNVPVEVTLREGRARILQELLSREGTRLKALAAATADEEERNVIDSRIIQLKRLETILLPRARTDDELNAVRRKIEEIAGTTGRTTILETTA